MEQSKTKSQTSVYLHQQSWGGSSCTGGWSGNEVPWRWWLRTMGPLLTQTKDSVKRTKIGFFKTTVSEQRSPQTCKRKNIQQPSLKQDVNKTHSALVTENIKHTHNGSSIWYCYSCECTISATERIDSKLSNGSDVLEEQMESLTMMVQDTANRAMVVSILPLKNHWLP